MGRRKTIIRIPKNVMLLCPHCSRKSRAVVDIDNCPQNFTCPKCSAEVRNPLTSCCVICAFSGKKCPRSLYMEARVKGLEMK